MQRKRRFWDGFLDVGIWLLFFALLLPAAFVGYAIGDDGGGATTVTVGEDGKPIVTPAEIEAAPAFSADDLNAEPTDRWITNGGSLANQRYSPLDEINTDNVAQLKGVWMTSLKGSGTAAKYSAEAQPIVYEGTMYVPTGADDVFAVDVGTGKIVWEYNAHLEQTISTVCCGWLSRGVAIGDGKVYLGQLDGKLVALDQKTGKVAWTTVVGRWQDGFTLTHAPLYYNGMVIVGGSGGEFSLRGRVAAFDAATGKLKWRFWTIPGPGETGHDTWPQDSDAWKTGGAPVWQTPAVDPELGLLYFSTGNAAPDLNGSKREGDNLFTASIVAVDAETGKYRWHYQQVHHDIWDYDGPSPVVLFDVDGKKGLAQASKTGWLYLLDRETGEPLLPIPEKPVPQLASQKTAKTQPIPSYPPFIPHEVTAEHVQAVNELKRANKPLKDVPVKRAEEVYTPFDDKAITVVVPGPQGGTNWQPTSYSPETEMFYVCAQAAFSGLVLSNATVPPGKQGSVADIGGSFVTDRVRRPPRLLHRDRRAYGRDQVAEALAGVVLFGLDRDGGRARLRRPEQRPPRGVRRRERRAQVELPDRCRRQLDGDRVRARRHRAHRVPGGRQRARGDAARRQPVALLPERNDGGALGRRRGGGRRRPRR